MVHQPLPDKTSHKGLHLIKSIPVPEIVLPRKPLYIAIQMLRRYLVKGSHMSTFEHGPEGFHAIGMGFVTDVFSDRVFDRFVIGKDMVGQGVVSVDLSVGSGCMFHDKAAQGFALGVLNDTCSHLVTGPVLDPGYGNLAYRPTSC